MQYNINMVNVMVVNFVVTDQNGHAVPASGYSANVTFGDPTVLSVGSNPTELVPQKLGSTTVQWTIMGKGSYSGTEVLPADTVNVNAIPLSNASVGYTIQ